MKLARLLPLLVMLSAAFLVRCVGDPPPTSDVDAGGTGSCNPVTCQAQTLECGTQGDGCGNAIECGTCKSGTVCSSGKCACVPKTCPDLGAQCGKVDDGCGTQIDCGGCASSSDACNQTTHACECKPQDCKAQGAECGSVADGCGASISCGTCSGNSAGPNCSAGKCGPTPCTPKKCTDLGINCGQVSDGCGGILSCGTCTLPQTCGGKGSANVCGCTAKTCPQLGKNCGSVPDQCGGTLACGSCTSPNSCGGGGTANICGCTPSQCGTSECGVHSDGCGGTKNCGTCTCFVPGTAVLMGDGTTRAIDSLHPGDLVMAFDEKTGQASARPVDHLAVHSVDESAKGLVLINDSIRVTPNHPFLVQGRRVAAGDLRVGDVLRTAVVDGHGVASFRDDPVRSVRVLGGGVVTYDIDILPPAGYFVGPDHIIVLIKLPP